MSKFWKALCKLTGIKQNMSTAFHPGASEHSNKTINQQIRYYVQRNQKGWVKALPKIRFDIMNTENASTGLSPFQLCLCRSPHTIPLIIPSRLAAPTLEVEHARDFLERINTIVHDGKDNLSVAKVSQAQATNKHQGKAETFVEGDHVMLSTLN